MKDKEIIQSFMCTVGLQGDEESSKVYTYESSCIIYLNGKEEMPEGSVPIFVFPHSITFYIADQTSHRQVLTLYNPYDFAVRFQVLGTSREKGKFTVVDPEGSINSHCCVDIVIRHNAVSLQSLGQVDKFRIQMYHFSTKKLIGKKDIKAEVSAGEADRLSVEGESFQQFPAPPTNQTTTQSYPLAKRQTRGGAPSGLVVGVALICATALLLPTQGEASSFIPDHLKPSINLKLVMAYVLGLVTMVLLRPHQL